MYKPAQNAKGVNQFIHCVELAVVGYKGGRGKIKLGFPDANPTMRHNVIFSPNVGTNFVSTETGKPVNITQKPPLVSQQMGMIFAQAGGRALVLGSGSGSSVLGFNRAGLHVVAIEIDPVQCAG